MSPRTRAGLYRSLFYPASLLGTAQIGLCVWFLAGAFWSPDWIRVLLGVGLLFVLSVRLLRVYRVNDIWRGPIFYGRRDIAEVLRQLARMMIFEGYYSPLIWVANVSVTLLSVTYVATRLQAPVLASIVGCLLILEVVAEAILKKVARTGDGRRST